MGGHSMSFLGRLAYLTLFPGMLFVLIAGITARGVLAAMSGAATGSPPGGPAGGLRSSYRLLTVESVGTWGSLEALQWAAPVVKLVALSWVSCVVTGFVTGDFFLVFALLLLAAASDLLLANTSLNPRVVAGVAGEAWWLIGWAVPLALVLGAVSVRTCEVGLSGFLEWQALNGGLLWAPGDVLAQTGTALCFVAAFFCVSSMARLRPLGRSLWAELPSGYPCDISGAPLVMVRASESSMFLLAPLLLVVLFLAGSAGRWYEVVFWALKVFGLLLVLGVVDLLSPRLRSGRAAVLSLVWSGTFALAGLVLIWLGVSL